MMLSTVPWAMLAINLLTYVRRYAQYHREHLLMILCLSFVLRNVPSMIVYCTLRIRLIDGVGIHVIPPLICTVTMTPKHAKQSVLTFSHSLMPNIPIDSVLNGVLIVALTCITETITLKSVWLALIVLMITLEITILNLVLLNAPL